MSKHRAFGVVAAMSVLIAGGLALGAGSAHAGGVCKDDGVTKVVRGGGPGVPTCDAGGASGDGFAFAAGNGTHADGHDAYAKAVGNGARAIAEDGPAFAAGNGSTAETVEADDASARAVGNGTSALAIDGNGGTATAAGNQTYAEVNDNNGTAVAAGNGCTAIAASDVVVCH